MVECVCGDGGGVKGEETYSPLQYEPLERTLDGLNPSVHVTADRVIMIRIP